MEGNKVGIGKKQDVGKGKMIKPQKSGKRISEKRGQGTRGENKQSQEHLVLVKVHYQEDKVKEYTPYIFKLSFAIGQAALDCCFQIHVLLGSIKYFHHCVLLVMHLGVQFPCLVRNTVKGKCLHRMLSIAEITIQVKSETPPYHWPLIKLTPELIFCNIPK